MKKKIIYLDAVKEGGRMFQSAVDFGKTHELIKLSVVGRKPGIFKWTKGRRGRIVRKVISAGAVEAIEFRFTKTQPKIIHHSRKRK